MTHQIPPGGLPALNIALDHDGGRVDPRTPKRVLSALDRAGLIRRDGAAWMVTAQGEAAVKATTGGQEGPEPRATVAELLGADPDWCGGESVDEYVRAHRDRTPAPVPGRDGNVLDDIRAALDKPDELSDEHRVFYRAILDEFARLTRQRDQYRTAWLSARKRANHHDTARREDRERCAAELAAGSNTAHQSGDYRSADALAQASGFIRARRVARTTTEET